MATTQNAKDQWGQKTVLAAETAPAAGETGDEAGADTQNHRWAYVTFDTPVAMTAAVAQIFMAIDDDQVPGLYETITLPTTALSFWGQWYFVAGLTRITALITTFTGTSYRRTIQLSDVGPTQ